MGQKWNQRITINTIMSAMNKEQNFVDCHTHILPGIDDGSKSPEESTEMLKNLLSQGVSTVWLTPHFYPYKEEIQSFLDKREDAYSVLKPIADKLNMEVLLASETFLTDYLFNIPDISKLCVNGQKYLLTELPFSSSFSQRTFDRIRRLVSNYGVVPILAHIERYPKLLKHVAYLDELIDMGCLMQMNLSALDGGLFQRRKLLTYIERNLVHIVGTDCHNLESRPPQYLRGMSIIEKKLGTDYVEQLMENTRSIINDSKRS